MTHLFTLLVILCGLIAAPAFAVEPDEVLDDPQLESRAREISAELRCMVCQNQSIDDSNADLARDLRVLVRERLVAGDSNEEVFDYVVSRYGEFVLLKPRVSLKTLALWGGPAIVLGFGIVAMVGFLRKRAPASSGDRLTAQEQEEVDALLRKRG